MAEEMAMAETAFIVPTPHDTDADYHLRWFTPDIEMDLCGHATLASAPLSIDLTIYDAPITVQLPWVEFG
jgi:PhzF family phenazine biosynthesis protein